MIFYDANGKLINLDRSKFISDELYYKKLYYLQTTFSKIYPKSVIINDIHNFTNSNKVNISYDSNLGYDSDSD